MEETTDSSRGELIWCGISADDLHTVVRIPDRQMWNCRYSVASKWNGWTTKMHGGDEMCFCHINNKSWTLVALVKVVRFCYRPSALSLGSTLDLKNITINGSFGLCMKSVRDICICSIANGNSVVHIDGMLNSDSLVVDIWYIKLRVVAA